MPELGGFFIVSLDSYNNAGHTIGEYFASGKPIEETIYLGDLPVSVLKLMPSMATAGVVGTSVYYIYADHINTSEGGINRTTDKPAPNGRGLWQTGD